MIGQKGVTPSVLKELDGALNAHELVKIKIAAEDRKTAQALVDEICATDAAIEHVQSIGKTLSVFRRNAQKPQIVFPK